MAGPQACPLRPGLHVSGHGTQNVLHARQVLYQLSRISRLGLAPKDFFLVMCMCGYLCMGMVMSVQVLSETKGIGSPEAGVTRDYEPPNTGPGNQTQVPFQSSIQRHVFKS